MSLNKLLSKSIHGFAIAVGLGGAAACTLKPELQIETRGIMQLGRAYERRLETQAKVMRHNDYRHYVKTASGSRLRVLRV